MIKDAATFCADCGAAIQSSTAARTHGLCMLCWKGEPHSEPPVKAAAPCPVCGKQGEPWGDRDAWCAACQAYYVLPCGTEPGGAVRELGTADPDERSFFRRIIEPYFLSFDRVTVEPAGRGLRIVWRTHSVFLLLLFVLAAYIGCRFIAIAWAQPAPGLLLALAAWSLLVYKLLANIVNRVTITAGGGRLSYSFGPLPHPGNISVDAASVRGLQWKIESSRGCGTFASYAVYAVIGSRTKLLLRNVPHGHAQVIAHAIAYAIQGKGVVGGAAS